jgi:hypothetical protein
MLFGACQKTKVFKPIGADAVAVLRRRRRRSDRIERRESMALKTSHKLKNKVNDQNFTTAISLDKTPREVFDAVNDVRGWWSEEIEGGTDKLGAAFKFHYKDLHRSTQKITEFVANKKVVWHVSDSRINFVKDKTEWNGTDIVFDIAKKGDKTELRFTHVGLVPALECYEDCSDAWGSYITDSLRNLVMTGKGQPNKKEKGKEKKAG